jgi:hypothetical protein
MNTEKLVTKRLHATRDLIDFDFVFGKNAYAFYCQSGLVKYIWNSDVKCNDIVRAIPHFFEKVEMFPDILHIDIPEDKRNLDDVTEIVNQDYQERIKKLLNRVLDCYI